jgi:hypothetical protein
MLLAGAWFDPDFDPDMEIVAKASDAKVGTS